MKDLYIHSLLTVIAFLLKITSITFKPSPLGPGRTHCPAHEQALANAQFRLPQRMKRRQEGVISAETLRLQKQEGGIISCMPTNDFTAHLCP